MARNIPLAPLPLPASAITSAREKVLHTGKPTYTPRELRDLSHAIRTIAKDKARGTPTIHSTVRITYTPGWERRWAGFGKEGA